MIFIKLLFGLIVTFFILDYSNIGQVVSLLTSLPLSLIIDIFLLIFISWVLAIYRWSVLLPKFSIKKLIEQTFIANFYSLILPGQIAGEIVKVFRLSRGQSDSEYIAASVLVDKLLGLLGLLVVAEIGLILSQVSIPLEIKLSITLCTLITFIGLIFLKLPFVYVFITNIFERMVDRYPKFKYEIVKIIQIMNVWVGYLNHPFRLFYAFLCAAIFQLISVWIIFLFSGELKIGLYFADWCWIWGLVSLAILLPISVAGFGVREGIFAGVFIFLDLPVEKSIVLSFELLGISMLGALIGGLLELFQRITSVSE